MDEGAREDWLVDLDSEIYGRYMALAAVLDALTLLALGIDPEQGRPEVTAPLAQSRQKKGTHEMDNLIWGVTDDTLDAYLASADWKATPGQRSTIEQSLSLILSDYLSDALYSACEEFIDEWEDERSPREV